MKEIISVVIASFPFYHLFVRPPLYSCRKEIFDRKPICTANPKNRFAFTLVKELEDKWRFGLEGSYTGKQYRDNETRTPGYLFAASMIQRNFGKYLSLVLNCENLFDYRQSNQEALFTGNITDPVFKTFVGTN